MNKLKTYDMSGAVSGDVELADELLVLGAGEQAVHDCVVATRNARRQGSASTLTKGEVAGSNKKPWRQKGTGRARAGYRQSPVWRGGATAFGPKPRSYAVKVNKKVGRLAFRRAFSEKVMAEQIKVLDELSLADDTTWVVDYRGLWGNDTADPLGGERGPAGPRYERSTEVRHSTTTRPRSS